MITNMYFLSQAYFHLPILTARNIPSFSFLLKKEKEEAGFSVPFFSIFLLFTASGGKAFPILSAVSLMLPGKTAWDESNTFFTLTSQMTQHQRYPFGVSEPGAKSIK